MSGIASRGWYNLKTAMFHSLRPIGISDGSLIALPKSPDDLAQESSSRILRNYDAYCDAFTRYSQEALKHLNSEVTHLLTRHPGICERLSKLETPITIDRQQPTIGVVIGGFASNDILLLAFADARARGERVPNVVMIDADAISQNTLLESSEGRRIALSYGAFFDGRTVSKFYEPIPLVIDLLLGAPRLDEGKRRWITDHAIPVMNSLPLDKITHDKIESMAIVAELGIPVPRQTIFSSRGGFQNDMAEILQSTAAFIDETNAQRYFVKPPHLSQGKGVEPFESDLGLDSIHAIAESIATHLRTHPEVILQEGINSYPVRIGQTRLDCNLRALCSKHGLIDIEVRAAPWGKAVNKSLGAKIWELEVYEKLAQREGLSRPFDARKIIKEVEEIGITIAKRFDCGFLGLDIIVNENGELVVIEVNGESSGGLVSLYNLRSEPRALDAANRFLSFAHKDCFRNREPATKPIIPSEEEPSMKRLARATHHFLYGDNRKSYPDFIQDLERITPADSKLLDGIEFMNIARACIDDERFLAEHPDTISKILESAWHYSVPAKINEKMPKFIMREIPVALRLMKELHHRSFTPAMFEAIRKQIYKALQFPVVMPSIGLELALDIAMADNNRIALAAIEQQLVFTRPSNEFTKHRLSLVTYCLDGECASKTAEESFKRYLAVGSQFLQESGYVGKVYNFNDWPVPDYGDFLKERARDNGLGSQG